MENDAPEVIRRFAVTASGSKATECRQDVTEGQTGAKPSAQDRHVMTPHVPGGHQERADQSAGDTPPACRVLRLKISRQLLA